MRAFAICSLLLLGVDGAFAQLPEPKPASTDQTAERKAESLKLAEEEVQRFAFYRAGSAEEEFKLHPDPIVRYGNFKAESYSNVFLWTDRGRPQAVASITNWYLPRKYRGLAVTSLAAQKLIGTRDGKEIWRPQKPGVTFRPIPGAGAPRNQRIQRLRTMRSLARGFSADFKRVARYSESGKLRLLSTPLYRYENVEAGVLDGAIFGLADGTAPQLVLLIEARPSPNGTRWEYAVAARNSMEFSLSYQGRQVWSLPQLAPPWPNSKIPTNIYTVFPDLQDEGKTEEFVRRLQGQVGEDP